MKLYMRQKVFSWTDRFTVWDEAGSEVYHVEGELFSWGKRLHVEDAVLGGEAALLQQKLFTLLPRYRVFIGDSCAAEIVKEFTLLRQAYTVEGPGWTAEGDLLAHDYALTARDRPVAEIHKQWMTWGDCYELDVARDQDALLALMVVLAIDCAMAAAASAS